MSQGEGVLVNGLEVEHLDWQPVRLPVGDHLGRLGCTR
jgi:hypothetical protein